VFSKWQRKHGTVSYELQVISGVIANVLHDVAMGHPFEDYRGPPIFEGVRSADNVEDVGVGQVLP
jgi:hypothetical protein